jgi:membrane protein DedA with SNARE-associated domain
MEPPTVHWILHHAGHWHYAWFALLVFVEGPTTTIAGAVLAASGVLDPWKVFFTAVASNLAADAFWFQIGQWLRTRGHWMEKVEKRYPLVRPLERKLREKAVAFLVIAKFTLSSVPALMAAGLSQVPWRKVLGVVVFADSAWIAFLTLLGYLLWAKVAYLALGLRVAVIVGFLVFAFILMRWAHGTLNGMLQEKEMGE